MCPSYATISAAEATYAKAVKQGKPDGINFSEKALHWCDSSEPANFPEFTGQPPQRPTQYGWIDSMALATLAKFGAADGGCFFDDPGQSFDLGKIGSAELGCTTTLANCARTTGFTTVNLTPKTREDYTKIQKHIMKHGPVVVRFGLFRDVSKQLGIGLVNGKFQPNANARPGDIVIIQKKEEKEEIGFINGHVVSIVGWDFSAVKTVTKDGQEKTVPDKDNWFWIIKDSASFGLAYGRPRIWKMGLVADIGLGKFMGGLTYTAPGAKTAMASVAPAAVASADGCITYTTSAKCELFTDIWKAVGGPEVQPLEAAFKANWEAFAGQDFTCLAVGTTLKFCK